MVLHLLFVASYCLITEEEKACSATVEFQFRLHVGGPRVSFFRNIIAIKFLLCKVHYTTKDYV